MNEEIKNISILNSVMKIPPLSFSRAKIQDSKFKIHLHSRESRFKVHAFVFVASLFPFVSLAAWTPGSPIIPCDAGDECNFSKLVLLGGNLVDLAFYISIPLAAIAFVYAGFLFVTAVGEPGKIKKAGEIFTKVAIGFIIVLSAWLIVSVIVKTLAPTPGFSLLG